MAYYGQPCAPCATSYYPQFTTPTMQTTMSFDNYWVHPKGFLVAPVMAVTQSPFMGSGMMPFGGVGSSWYGTGFGSGLGSGYGTSFGTGYGTSFGTGYGTGFGTGYGTGFGGYPYYGGYGMNAPGMVYGGYVL